MTPKASVLMPFYNKTCHLFVENYLCKNVVHTKNTGVKL